jgi:hypothetical protein
MWEGQIENGAPMISVVSVLKRFVKKLFSIRKK